MIDQCRAPLVEESQIFSPFYQESSLVKFFLAVLQETAGHRTNNHILTQFVGWMQT